MIRPPDRPVVRPDRPTINRPEINRPEINRPIVNRPEVNRPIVNRPEINKPTINRPVINKPTNVVNRPVNNTVINGGTTINSTVVNNVNNRGGNNINVANFNRPWGGYHNNWYYGNWGGRWDRIPSFWAGYGVGRRDGFLAAGGLALGLSAIPVFYNPYFIAPPPPTIVESPATVVVQTFDYSQPIALPTPEEQQAADRDLTQEAIDLFDSGRAAFKKGLYSTARSKTDSALKLLPGDTTMHEFRALTFFAEKKYTDAAGGLYAVLAAGPGMDWETMASLYPDQDTYAKHLRALEDFVKGNPKSGEGHFVLAYHYMVLGETEAAATEFAAAHQINPKDELSKSFYLALTEEPEEKPAERKD